MQALRNVVLAGIPTTVVVFNRAAMFSARVMSQDMEPMTGCLEFTSLEKSKGHRRKFVRGRGSEGFLEDCVSYQKLYIYICKA